jgi:antitoxin FitA
MRREGLTDVLTNDRHFELEGWRALFRGFLTIETCTCAAHVYIPRNMSKMIQIRDVPEELHNVLKARAARAGTSLSDFIKKELEQAVELPTMREWLERTQQAKPIVTERSAAEVVRELRGGR